MKIVFSLIVLLGSAAALGFYFWAYGPEVADYPSSWQLQAEMPTPRSEIAATSSAVEVYIAGGISAAGLLPQTSDAFERYNVEQNAWTRLPALPQPRHHVAMAMLGDAVYAVGGFSNLRFRASADAWRYSIKKQQWQPIAALPEPRGEHAMVAVADKLYVVAGSSPRSQEVWVYSVADGSWRPVGEPMPTARDSAAVVAVGRDIWVLGGRRRAIANSNMTVVEIFDSSAGTWRSGPELPAARAGHAAALINGSIYVFGGEDLATATVHPEVFQYDLAKDQWQQAGNLPRARHGSAAATAGNKLFAIGGGLRAGLRTPFSLSAATAAFTMESP